MTRSFSFTTLALTLAACGTSQDDGGTTSLPGAFDTPIVCGFSEGGD